MKRALWVFLCGLTLQQAGGAAQPALLPAPAQISTQAGSLSLPQEIIIELATPDAGTRQTADWLIDLVGRTTPLHARLAAAGESGQIILRQEGAGKAESYHLAVTDHAATISAPDGAGLFYGAVTLWQLITDHPGAAAIALPAVTIDDAPRFAWRGLMLDSARHFQSPAYIKQFIDWMALHKLNMFHWHLTDDQGWRLEIRKYPKLTAIGGWRVRNGADITDAIDPVTGRQPLYGGYYTQDQVREIVAYAAARHVTIVPELDMPGHAMAAIAAYPALGVGPGRPSGPGNEWGVYPWLYNVDDSTFSFIEDVLGEVLTLFPGQFIHVGGDEAVKDQWQGSPHIQAQIKALGLHDEAALQSYFVKRLDRFLTAHGRRLIGWDEILEGDSLAANATVMSWRGVEGTVTAAKAGHDTVLSASPMLYLDNRQFDQPGDLPGRGFVVTLKDVYAIDPVPAGLTGQERAHLLGLQANIWTEQIATEQRVTKMTWPRAAAVAELAWSEAARRDWEGFSARLAVQRARYRLIGLEDAGVESPPPVDPPGPLPPPRNSQQLRQCNEARDPLLVESVGPLKGPRSLFLIDILGPCWIYPGADLSGVGRITVSVGHIPYNFQEGKDIAQLHFDKPRTKYGELEVRLDRCDGPPALSLPMTAAARASQSVTLLQSAFSGASGRHDLCFSFTAAGRDPLWALDSVSFGPKTGQP